MQIHHITHWADGGVTSIENGVCVCSYHHTMLHEGGHVIQKVEGDAQRMVKQFIDQQHENDLAMFEVEKPLRNNQASFADIRALSPTRYRFRVIDANGIDIRNSHSSIDKRIDNAANDNHQCSIADPEDTRVSCSEPIDTRALVQLTTTEQPARFRADVVYH